MFHGSLYKPHFWGLSQRRPLLLIITLPGSWKAHSRGAFPVWSRVLSILDPMGRGPRRGVLTFLKSYEFNCHPALPTGKRTGILWQTLWLKAAWLFGGRGSLEGFPVYQVHHPNLPQLPQRTAGCIQGSQQQLCLPNQDAVQKDDPNVGCVFQRDLVGLSYSNGPLCASKRWGINLTRG